MPRPGFSKKARKAKAARLRSSHDRSLAKLRKLYGILPRKEQEALDAQAKEQAEVEKIST